MLDARYRIDFRTVAHCVRKRVKGHDLSVRCDINPPSMERIDMKMTVGKSASYRLLSIPVYLAERIADFIDQIQDNSS